MLQVRRRLHERGRTPSCAQVFANVAVEVMAESILQWLPKLQSPHILQRCCHVLLPSGLPVVAVFQCTHHTKLRVLMPLNLVCLAPRAHLEVTCVGKTNARFLVGM